MNRDILDRRRAERFAQLLDETNGAPRRHTQIHSDRELAELVAVGNTLTRMRPTAGPDPEFRSSLRAMLIATAERDGIGVTATGDGSGAHAAEPERRRRGFFIPVGAGRRIRARGAIVIGVAAGALAVSGMSAASEDAVPGDALYGVKRSTERAQLALTGSPVTRGQLFLDFARNRLMEASAVNLRGTDLSGVLTDMDADTVAGVRLLTSAAMQRKDEAALNAVDVFVVGQRRQMDQLLSRIGPSNEKATGESLRLLTDIDARVRALRASLKCDPQEATGTDRLGPKPHTCWAAPDRNTDDAREQRAREDRKPGTEDSATRPGARVADPADPSADPAAGNDDGVGSVPGGTRSILPPVKPVVPTPTAGPTQSPIPAPVPSVPAGGGLPIIGDLLD